MDLRQLAALVAVADHGGFSAAADALHTVQSNVSSHVARLERELGVTLVDRQAGRLTDEGAVVVARARRVSTELEGVLADLAALHDQIVGSARVGMIGTTARWLVPQLFALVNERHPGVHLVVVDATSTSLEPRLLAGELDLAVVNLPVPGRDLATESLFDEDLVLVVPRGHPLTERPALTMVDLASVELLLPPPGTSFRGELDTAAAAAGILLRPRAEVDGLRLIAGMAMEGQAPAVIPSTGVSGPSDASRWQALSVAGLPRRRVGIAQRRRGLPAAPARAVLEVLREIAHGATGHHGLHPPAL